MEQVPETADDALSGADAGPSRTEEVDVVVSDLHLSAGKVLRVRAKHTFRYEMTRLARRLWNGSEPVEVIEVPNPLEDFPHDAVFEAFVAKIASLYGGAGVLRFRLMGDTFDPLAMTWKGSLRDPPYETVGVRKMRIVIQGHARFFDALARLVRMPNAHLDVFVGNHDQFISWPRVQREIVRRIAGGEEAAAARIRFIDQSRDYEDQDRGVLYYHGMNSEPHNGIDPKTAILTDRFGLKLKRPILNKPLGSHMAIDLAAHLKLKNQLVGRLPLERDIWKDALKHKWGWGFYAGVMVIWFLYVQFFAVWDYRRKTGLGTVLKVIGATLHKNPVDEYAAKQFRRREGVRVIVMGHSHVPRRMTGPDGTYINTGSWAQRLRLVWPTLACTWPRFRRIEVLWRNLLHFFKTGKIPFADKLGKIIGYAAAIGLLVTYLFMSFSKNDGFGDWSVTLHQLKFAAGVILAIVMLKGVLRFFAVTPEVEDDSQFTFALVRRGPDGALSADLMEYLPKDGIIRECV